MKEEEFIRVSNEVLEIIKANYTTYQVDSKVIIKIKLYIENHQDTPAVKQFIYKLLQVYTVAFFNNELIAALSLDDVHPFYKIIKIYKNLIRVRFPYYSNYLGDILTYPSDVYYDIYRTYPLAIKKYMPEFDKDPGYQYFLNLILKFIENNSCLMRGGIGDYAKDEDEEIERFKEAERKRGFEERNKRLGNIGELLLKKYLEQLNYKPFLVAKEIKDGFGYDIHLFDQADIENLIEVKTTTSTRSEDYFVLTPNEYDVLKQAALSPKSRYLICRIKLTDFSNGTCKFYEASDDKTLVDYKTRIPTYTLHSNTNGEYCFVQIPQSPQVLKK